MVVSGCSSSGRGGRERVQGVIEVFICYFFGFAALGKLLSFSVHQFSGLHWVSMRNGLRNNELGIRQPITNISYLAS